MKFSIFSHGQEKGTEGLRRSDVEGTEGEARRAARMLEVLGDGIDGIVQTDCQESGQRMRQVERTVQKQGRK